MTGGYRVRFAERAAATMLALHEFLLERASTVEELADADDALEAIRSAVHHQLARNPYLYRKVGSDTLRRELVIPWRAGGYVALYQIRPTERTVYVLAVRHQREADYP